MIPAAVQMNYSTTMDYFVCENPECRRKVFTDSAERLEFRCPACHALLRGVLLAPAELLLPDLIGARPEAAQHGLGG